MDPARTRSGARIQICGRVAVEIDGSSRESELPGQQGRALFALLVVHRAQAMPRSEVIEALWAPTPPPAVDSALNALVSKLRRIVSCRAERGLLQLDLPPDCRIDLEDARDAAHRAESATAQQDWPRAWGAAQTALFTARRGFLPGEDATWIDPIRAELHLLHQRALETYASAALHIGNTELLTAERASRELIALAPLRESGHRLLMKALTAQGNNAQALMAYEDLRVLLRHELGITPSPDTQVLHAELLRGHP